MSTPIETTAEALKDSKAGSWRGVARDALVSLAQHRDDIARVLSTQTTCDGQPHPSELHYRQADAVLAYLAGEGS